MCKLRGTFYTEPWTKVWNLVPPLFLSQRYRIPQALAFTRNFPAWASLHGPLLRYCKISHWFQPLWSTGKDTLLEVLNTAVTSQQTGEGQGAGEEERSSTWNDPKVLLGWVDSSVPMQECLWERVGWCEFPSWRSTFQESHSLLTQEDCCSGCSESSLRKGMHFKEWLPLFPEPVMRAIRKARWLVRKRVLLDTEGTNLSLAFINLSYMRQTNGLNVFVM